MKHLEIVIDTTNMASKELIAIAEALPQINQLGIIGISGALNRLAQNNSNFSNKAEQDKGSNNLVDGDIWKIILEIARDNAGYIYSFLRGDIRGATAEFVSTLADEVLAGSAAQAAAAAAEGTDIDIWLASTEGVWPGGPTTRTEFFDTSKYAIEQGYANSNEDLYELFKGLNWTVLETGKLLHDFDKSLIDALRFGWAEVVENIYPPYKRPPGFDDLPEDQKPEVLKDSFYSQTEKDRHQGVGYGGEQAGNFWSGWSRTPPLEVIMNPISDSLLQIPNSRIEQEEYDYIRQFNLSLERQDEKLMSLAQSQWEQNNAAQLSIQAWGDRYQAQADAFVMRGVLPRQDEKLMSLAQSQWEQNNAASPSMQAWGDRYQVQADAYALHDLNIATEDFLGLSTNVSESWAAFKTEIIEVKEKGFDPLNESAEKLKNTMRAYEIDEADAFVMRGVLPATEQSPPTPKPRSKDEKPQSQREQNNAAQPYRQAWRDRYQVQGDNRSQSTSAQRYQAQADAYSRQDRAFPPRRLRAEQKKSMFAFKDIGLASGGPLSDLALVGEEGPEMIINGVVVPAQETRKLMALGLLPGRRFATGGPLDGSYAPMPVDFDPLTGLQRHASLDQGTITFLDRPLSSGGAPSSPQIPASQGEDQNASSVVSLETLFAQSLAQSTSLIAETQTNELAEASPDPAMQHLQATMRIMQQMQQSIQQGNANLNSKFEHLTHIMERQLLESKRMKIYFRDAVRLLFN